MTDGPPKPREVSVPMNPPRFPWLVMLWMLTLNDTRKRPALDAAPCDAVSAPPSDRKLIPPGIWTGFPNWHVHGLQQPVDQHLAQRRLLVRQPPVLRGQRLAGRLSAVRADPERAAVVKFQLELGKGAFRLLPARMSADRH